MPTMTYQQVLETNQITQQDAPDFDNGLLVCSNCSNPASASLSIAAGWFGCAPCMTGEVDSYDDGDLITYS